MQDRKGHPGAGKGRRALAGPDSARHRADGIPAQVQRALEFPEAACAGRLVTQGPQLALSSLSFESDSERRAWVHVLGEWLERHPNGARP